MNLKTLDLNLLVALKALLDEKHVTRAADKIGLSQPAMSRALGRLRLMFKDPLLVRSTTGLCLTSTASNLYQPLQSILTEINQLISPQSFNPALINKEIIISTRDYEITVILPDIINRVAKVAPGITFRISSLLGDDLKPLEKQEVDFVLAGSGSQSTTLSRYTLYKERFICLISANNPQAQQQNLSLKQYLAMKHCSIAIKNSGHGIVDTALAKRNLKREITVRIPHFLAAAQVVSRSDLIITLPYRLAAYMAEQMNVMMIEPPIKLPSFPIYLYWHIRNQNDAVHTWLRKMIRSSCEERSVECAVES